MTVFGIVAEFNPFHNGHYHLIQTIKEEHKDASVICVMSGNFVQRGMPAICNKWARAAMALQGGADLVIELPFCFATRSAYNFARGAVMLLEQTKIVTHLAFGSESNNLNDLNQVASLLEDETDEYKVILKAHLTSGLSYPAARAKALEEYFADPLISPLLLGSNNILAIEYLKVLLELNSNILPFTIERQGSNYHDTVLSAYASATAIRQALYANTPISELLTVMPTASQEILAEEIEQGRAPSQLDIFENILLYRLRTMNENEMSELYDVTEGIEKRIIEKALSGTNIEDVKQAIKTKRYNLTKINRILLYSLFNLTKPLVTELDYYGPLYHHVLGFNSQGQKLLHQIKTNSEIPVLSRGKDVKAIYDLVNDPAGKMINLDVKSTNVYNLCYPSCSQRIGHQDFTTSPRLSL